MKAPDDNEAEDEVQIAERSVRMDADFITYGLGSV